MDKILSRNWTLCNSLNTIRLIKQSNTGSMIACKRRDVKCALEWIHMCDPRHVNIRGETALILACQNGLDVVAKKLIEGKCARITHRDNSGQSALDYSQLYSHMDGISVVLLYLSKNSYDGKYEELAEKYFN